MARKVGRSHVGGFQPPLPMIDSPWVAPSELPDIGGKVAEIAIDTEAKDDGIKAKRGPGWATGQAMLAGVSVAWDQGGERQKIYVPVRHPDSSNFDHAQVGSWLTSLMDGARTGKSRLIFQSAHYDLGLILHEWGLRAKGVNIDDTIAMAVAVDENRLTYNLDDLCKWQGIPGKDETLLRGGAAAYDINPKSDMWRLPARLVGPYAEQDPSATLDLARKLRPIILKEKTGDAYQLEMDLVSLVIEMRKHGVAIDVKAAESALEKLRELRTKTLDDLRHRLAYTNLEMKHLRSADFMEHAFDKEQIPYPTTAKTGRGSFTKEWMTDFDHWLPQLCQKALQYDAAAEKFVDGFILGFVHNGRLHANINQYKGEDGKGTKTTRFSYSEPPLQEMPSRDEAIASLIRACFIPEPGEKWLGADYSQQELRLMVHYASLVNLSRSQEARQLYLDDPDTDYHQLVIGWTGLDRKSAKNATFAKSYGAQPPKFATMIHKPLSEAVRIMTAYDTEVPFVKELAEFAEERAKRFGFIKLLDGARSHFNRWEPAWRDANEEWHAPTDRETAEKVWPKRRLRRADTRNAMSRLIQGGAARQTKLAMRAVWNEGLVPLLQMHDELGFSIGDKARGSLAVECMKTAAPLQVPSKVDGDYGVNWGESTHDVPKGEEWRKEWEHVEPRAA